jgi:ABC-2 type transport system permease protein
VRVLLRIVVKEFLQLRRDKKMIPAMIIGPLVQLLALGFAANLDVTDVPMALVDLDRTSASRALVDRFVASGRFRLVAADPDARSAGDRLAEGSADVVLVIDAGFQARTESGRTAHVQVLADGTDSNSAVVGLGYASRIIGEASADLARRDGAGAVGSIDLVPRVWYNPDLKSRWFYVPAILAMVLMLVTMILPSMAVVREKEIGTLEQLIVTPVRSWQLIVGKLAPFFVIGVLDMLLVSGLVVFLFRVPLRGSFLLLAGITCLFLLTTLGLGLLVSTLVRTQQQAMMTATFLLMVPMIYLSGLIFPIENMPQPIQWATYAIPLRYYNNVIRGVFLKGSGLEILWREGLVLAGFGVTVLTLAALRFRKKLD